MVCTSREQKWSFQHLTLSKWYHFLGKSCSKQIESRVSFVEGTQSSCQTWMSDICAHLKVAVAFEIGGEIDD
jgi:hypothetical protein